MSNLLTVAEAAELLGVSTKTIRRWETDGRIKSIRTEGGHRRFRTSDLIGNKQNHSLTLAYARVSSNAQKKDLDRQKVALHSYCAKNGWSCEVISDLGSGVNYRKSGLIKLIKLICSHQVERLILTHKDQLLILGSDLIFTLCEIFGTEVVMINCSQDSTFEEVLVQDVLEIIAIFSARLYGLRNYTNKQIVKQLKEIAKQLE
ncbi:MAG: IS607 family transposase [Cyanobacteriota bacterium]|nr:IS607 family transposase [Cyanobacteriota bacterium]